VFDYPQIATLKQLEAKNPDYIALAPLYQTIDDLVLGGNVMDAKKEQYLLKRPGEDAELYRLRISKFVYTNILGDCLRELTDKVSGAELHVDGISGDDTPEATAKFWSTWRDHTDGYNRKERGLLNQLFLTLLKFKTAYCLIDKPAAPLEPVNRLQEEALGLTPYAALISPLEIYDWQLDGDRLQWAKIRQVTTDYQPLGDRVTRITWTFIDSTQIVKYSARVELGRDGSIKKLIDNAARNGQEDAVALTSRVSHGRKKIPLIRCELPDNKWASKDAYLKALQYLQIENGWTDTASIAGYVQRLFKPQVKPDDDISATYTDDDEYVSQIKSSNAHILIGDDFRFVEIAGSSLKTIRDSVLEPIKGEIKAIISLGNVSAAKGVMEQSGTSKSFDYAQFNDALRAYGEILVNYYQDILRAVAEAAGYDSETISVSGLDTFDLDTLDTLLAQTKELINYEDRIPATAMKLWMGKIVAQMHRSASAKQQEEMGKELEDLFAQMQKAQDDPIAAMLKAETAAE
jgi:hypothetical protein